MGRKVLVLLSLLIITGSAASLFIVCVHGENFPVSAPLSSVVVHADHFHEKIRRMQEFKASLIRRNLVAASPGCSPAPAPAPSSSSPESGPRIYRVISYGADPTGKSDSTEAILKALSDAYNGPREGSLIKGIANLGGAEIQLEGGDYLISKPLRFPDSGVGNIMIHGGTLRASDDFPTDGYLIDLSPPSSSSSSSSSSSYNYEYITLRDLLLDSNFRGGGVSVINSLRTSIDNCYVAHFTSNGILVQSGHETFIRNSFLGQHITAGGDPDERDFTGTAINLMGNDNAVTDVVIFSAAVGIMVSGQANIFSGVHCYNKATGFGGTGIYLKLPGNTQTRIVNCYMDYTGIVAEDPVLLHISSSFFLGNAAIVLKSINGVANGVNIVDNLFSGDDNNVEIVRLDQSKGAFKQIDQIVVDRNNVQGMKKRATVGTASKQGNGTSWKIDFSSILLFPNLIKNVQYSFLTTGGSSSSSSSSSSFPKHALRNVSQNRVVIESDVAVPASVFVSVDQSVTI